MSRFSNMELLPTIIIVALLGFFITLTLALFYVHHARTRVRSSGHRDEGFGPSQPRKMTVRSGKVIPTSEAAETLSTRKPMSLDLSTPLSPLCFDFDIEKRLSQPPALTHVKKKNRQSWLGKDRETRLYEFEQAWLSKGPGPLEEPIKEEKFFCESPAFPRRTRDSPPSLPRPSLINIEKRGSGTQTQPSSRTTTRRHAKALYDTYKHFSILGRPVYELPATPVATPGKSRTPPSATMPAQPQILAPVTKPAQSHTAASSTRTSGLFSFLTWTGSKRNAQAVSETIKKPAPVFTAVDYRPRVRFAASQEPNRDSFISMTGSQISPGTSLHARPTSANVPSNRSSLRSISESDVYPGVSANARPTIYAPPTYAVDLSKNSETSLPSPGTLAAIVEGNANDESDRVSGIVKDGPVSMITDRAPSIHVNIPHTEDMIFECTPTSPHRPTTELQRGPSARSDRSAWTIASSEISSDWTIGKAEAVSIHRTVSDDRSSPSYSRTLRSKYGRYPRGRRDKALPTVPISPISQFLPEIYGLR